MPDPIVSHESFTQSSDISKPSALKLFGGVLLVAGTCIGAGMLSLPVSTASAGFYWTSSVFMVCWAMMTLTAFYMLEVSLWHKEETNLVTMANDTLGVVGRRIAWVTYILFLFSLMAAYTSGGTAIAGKLLGHLGLPPWVASSSFIVFFSAVVYMGAHWVDVVNRGFMIGLIITYLGLVVMGTSEVDVATFSDGQSKYLLAAMPLLVTSFGFHLLIPTLKTYFDNDVKKLRLCIFLGSLIPLLVYLLWEFIILGCVPISGPDGLIAMYQNGNPVVELTETLSNVVESDVIGPFARAFTFFALISSFIGVALGVFDFLADGLHVKKTHKGRAMLALLTFGPPSLFVWIYPNGFIIALSYAGVFASILLIIYPALMAYVGRYRVKMQSDYEVMGGKSLMLLAMAFGVGVIVLQIMDRLGLLPVPSL